MEHRKKPPIDNSVMYNGITYLVEGMGWIKQNNGKHKPMVRISRDTVLGPEILEVHRAELGYAGYSGILFAISATFTIINYDIYKDNIKEYSDVDYLE